MKSAGWLRPHHAGSGQQGQPVDDPILAIMGFDPVSSETLATQLGLTQGRFTRCCWSWNLPAS
jgi:hypothetical protein